MEIQSEPSLDSAQGEETGQGTNNEGWQLAKDRVLLFIGMLGLPPVEGLELALKAIKGAQEDQAKTTHPITQAMRTLRKLLAERDSSSQGTPRPPANGIPSVPPLNRGSMVSYKR